MTVCKTKLQPMKKKKRCYTSQHRLFRVQQKRRLLVVFGFQDFTTTVEAVRADVVTQVGFTGGWLDASCGATRNRANGAYRASMGIFCSVELPC
jgi:hypothetical protein